MDNSMPVPPEMTPEEKQAKWVLEALGFAPDVLDKWEKKLTDYRYGAPVPFPSYYPPGTFTGNTGTGNTGGGPVPTATPVDQYQAENLIRTLVQVVNKVASDNSTLLLEIRQLRDFSLDMVRVMRALVKRPD